MPRRGKYTKKSTTGRKYKRADHYAASKIQAVVRRALAQNIETKQGVQTSSDGLEILHNNFVVMTNAPLHTIQGDGDQDGGQGQRIGDKINLKGLSIRFMTELNERYSDVSFRFLFVKSAKGDTPTRATLFNGVSGNKMLDTLNRERYTILKDKWFKIKAANLSTTGGSQATSSGINAAYGSSVSLTRATKIQKIWIPGDKVVKSGILQYEDNSTQVKFFDYHCLLYAYSNYSCNQDLYNVGRLNDLVVQMYYKDA